MKTVLEINIGELYWTLFDRIIIFFCFEHFENKLSEYVYTSM